jgi:hypothetical protein
MLLVGRLVAVFAVASFFAGSNEKQVLRFAKDDKFRKAGPPLREG